MGVRICICNFRKISKTFIFKIILWTHFNPVSLTWNSILFCQNRNLRVFNSQQLGIFQTSVSNQETEHPVIFFTLIHFVVLLSLLEVEAVPVGDTIMAAASA